MEVKIGLIKKEIEWALAHPAKNLPKKFQEGFVAGLQQAIYILESKPKVVKG